ncbi:hypothetical protein ES703_70373 [subsurface metagenome]
MITDAIVRRVKYPPELIPDSWFGAVPLNSESTPPILDLRRFGPYITILTNIQLAPNANVVLRAKYGDDGKIRIEENTAAMLSYLDGTPATVGLPGAWRLPSKNLLYYNLFGVVGAPVANYPTQFGLWVFTPTIAHKLVYNINLTPDERSILEELGITNTVEKGLLPLPIDEQIGREYYVLGEETHSRSINIAAAGTTYTIEVIYPESDDEFIVLTRIAMAPGTAAQDVRFIVDRDDDTNFAQLMAFASRMVAGGEISCFIPATREIRLTTTSTVAPGAHLFRYTYQRIKLSNLLRVRFGLVSRDEVPADLWKKVQGGIL